MLQKATSESVRWKQHKVVTSDIRAYINKLLSFLLLKRHGSLYAVKGESANNSALKCSKKLSRTAIPSSFSLMENVVC